ncbi:FtsX-like permease family protein [Segetibacter sp. 3557_3]|uniref:ABC transporter permease n=1 Tax=Segetibacter sp. 3557_3 TaxID=2547429 RepID=UPI001058DEAA|nr:ABC transporter permease [Segetibacter sp. 3557_3]TDH28782.1 FtsX-like permease family protein [Segetibacter sp. 3557_3]
MLRNYFKVAVRYLAKHKGYTLINIAGLAVGIACCMLIMLFVKSELSYDRFHVKADRIYRAWLEEHYEGEVFTNVVTPVPLGPVLQNNLPEVQITCRVFSYNALVKYNNNTFNDEVNMVDSTFYTMFDFSLLEGDRNNPFPTSNSVVITASAAKRLFGKTPPLNKNVELQLGSDKVLFTVTGVAKDNPLESSIRFSMLIPFSNAPRFWSEQTRTQSWSNVSLETYVLLKEGASPVVANGKIASIMNPLVSKTYKPGQYKVTLQPITDIHLNNALPEGNQPISNPKYSYILGTIGLLVLLIACINFVTLSVGRSAKRALEVGVRKVLGAERGQLIRQFWGEALLLTLCALLIGVLLAILFLNPFNTLADRQLALKFDGFTVLFCIALVVVIGLIAGIYPAVVLSGFKPIQVLKGRLKTGQHMGLFRKALVVGQFVASIIMIICTITIGKQLHYLRSKDLGYNKEQLVVIPTNKSSAAGNALATVFKSTIAQNPQVASASRSLFSFAEYGWMSLGYKDNGGVFRQFQFNVVDEDFIKTMKLQLVQGRAFEKGNTADSNHIIINEAMAKAYGWENPIGQTLPGKYTQRIIGVVRDFHIESLHTGIKPVMLALKGDSIFQASSDVRYQFSPRPRISVRLLPGDVQKQLEGLRTIWKSVAGDQEFEYQFLDDALNNAYRQEQRLGNIVQYASFISIFIACMGLFGLATLVVVRRTKEIGVRKVLGAETSNILGLLSKDFIVLIFIAAIIAFPLAWWALYTWLQDFNYRITIPVWVFGAAALITLVVAMATVSFQALKAAWANPVKSLRAE